MPHPSPLSSVQPLAAPSPEARVPQSRAGSSAWPSPLPPLRRINVVGVSGSGKSTFSARLAALLGSPYVQMDQVFWEPNWTEPPDSRFFPRLAQAIAGERWVLDGNYHRTAPLKWARTETVVWLDYALPRVLWQVARRSVSRALRGQELWPDTGNRESWSRVFSRQSMVRYTWRTHASHRLRYERVLAARDWPHLHFVRLKTPRETDAFLQSVRHEAASTTFPGDVARG